MSLEPVIRLERLSKRFRGQVALDNVSLEVPPGVVFALLGENGAGKTTLIQIMLGLLEPDAGRSRVLGLDSQQHGIEIRRSAGYVSERPAIDEWMTVKEVGWFAAGFHQPGFLENYERHAAEFDLPLGKKLRQLSKGMRSKVALSLALAQDPKLLVLDEPTSGLDALVRREFLESMVDFTANGRTVFLSSHQIHEVERVADVVAILRHGKLLCCQSLDLLKANTCEVTLTYDDERIAVELPGPVLTSRQRGRQRQLMVAATPDEARDIAQSLPRIEQFEIRSPNLEEIFVAYMQSSMDSTDAVIPDGDRVEVQP